jgi:peroxiredoxin Q/BCP
VTSYARVRVGDLAPDFTLTSDAGTAFTLSALRGKRVVLFFYAKDASPGCSLEASQFAAEVPKLTRAGAVIVGIGPGNARAKARFKAKCKLNFSLLADEHAEVAQAYGIWHEKLLFGHRYLGMMRTTYVIGADGRVEHLWEHVEYDGHAAEVSAAVRGVSRMPLAKPTAKTRSKALTSQAAKKK